MKKFNCPKCGEEVNNLIAYCPKCFTKLYTLAGKTKTCAACGNDIMNDLDVCPICGKDPKGAAPAAAPAAPAGESKMGIGGAVVIVLAIAACVVVKLITG